MASLQYFVRSMFWSNLRRHFYTNKIQFIRQYWSIINKWSNRKVKYPKLKDGFFAKENTLYCLIVIDLRCLKCFNKNIHQCFSAHSIQFCTRSKVTYHHAEHYCCNYQSSAYISIRSSHSWIEMIFAKRHSSFSMC